jgi:multiple sugar transport system substrate-binding protein
MQRIVPVLLAAALVTAPLGASAADLIVWWDQGFYPQEDEAVAEIVAAFEQQSGKQVELAFYSQAEFSDEMAAAVEAGRPPDFAFSLAIDSDISSWAFDDRLVDLTDAVGFFSDLFDPDALAWSIWTSPASACCRRCRSCSSSRSGSTRAIRTAWPR